MPSVYITTDRRIYTATGRNRLSPDVDLQHLALRAINNGYSDVFLDFLPSPDDVSCLHERGIHLLYSESPPQFIAQVPTGNGAVFLHSWPYSNWHVKELDALEPTAICAALDRLARELHCSYLGYSPGWRGIANLKRTKNMHPTWFMFNNIPAHSYDDHAANWVYAPASKVGEYLHQFDMRAAYLAAARTLPLGAGQYRKGATFDRTRAGRWRVEVTSPPSAVRYSPIQRSGWYDTAMVRAQIAHNAPCDVRHGYVWESQPLALRSWAEKLLAARENCAAQPEVIGLLKAVYSRSMGRLGTKDGNSWENHPHWWAAIVAEVARRLYAHIGTNPYVIGAATDAIFVVHPSPDPREAFPPFAARTTTGPGTLRHVGYTPWTRGLEQAATGTNGAKFGRELQRRNVLEKWGA